MGFALVYGAEHYVVDLLLGALIAGVVWRATRRLEGRLAISPVAGSVTPMAAAADAEVRAA